MEDASDVNLLYAVLVCTNAFDGDIFADNQLKSKLLIYHHYYATLVFR